MTEEWIQIKNSRYYVSNYGRIKSVYKKSEKILRLIPNNKGYFRVKLSIDLEIKNYFVHRLVALYFIINTNENNVVNHKDGNAQNNTIENLEWVTQSENIKHALYKLHRPITKYGKDNGKSKMVYCSITGKRWDCIREAANDLNISIWTLYKRIQRGIGDIKIVSSSRHQID